ncbi:MAG: cation-transporting P-type ATPase [Methanomicrobiales archaeon]|nr:cation-transporting P-type ATPase [Methanomicrobiales archaeon]
MYVPEHPHACSVEEVQRSLETGSQGLSEEEVARRRESFGKNLIEEEEVNKLELFLRQFRNFLIYILVVAALISLFTGDLKDFGVIIALILANGLIGFWQELKAETSIRALKQLTETRVRVLREGKINEIPSRELVPGDLILLGEGDMVPADIRLIESQGLQVDEALLTGESVPVEKDHRAIVPVNAQIFAHANSLLSGTAIVRGSAKGFVVRTGRFTYLASITEKAKESSPSTPFERAIRSFSTRYAAIITMVLAVVGISAVLQQKEWVRIAYLLVAQLVSAVPEGLPLVVTLVMVIGALRLSRKKTLTRHLPSVETLGSATVIASDKTGTITEGRLKVERVHAIDRDALVQCAALCNDAEGGRGDPIDVALAHWVEGCEGLRRDFPRVWTFPFDTWMKLMATAHEFKGERRFFVKGAFEALLPYAEPDDELTLLGQIHDKMAGEGLRVLAFGAGGWHGPEPEGWRFRIVGLVGFLDPPKGGVREAVRTAKKAGIRVIMITGDHPMTAKKVAASVEIFAEGDRILTGTEIEQMEDRELYAALMSATVLARILPEHKYRVVKVLQANQEIVAVTGDGVNDVPALKVADLGIAMGSGAEAAKGVAKMVILDSNLNVIVDAIKTGG